MDVALRVRDVGLEDPGLVARRIATGRMVLVASPAFVQQAADDAIDDPSSLAKLGTIGLLHEGREQSWNLQAGDGRSLKVPHRPRLLCSDYTVALDAAAGGVGIALLPLRIVWRGLENGTLQHVAKDWGSAEQALHLVYVSRRGMLPAVRALVDHLIQQVPMALAF